MRIHVRVVGVGSLLRSDDGVGVRVAEELLRRGPRQAVEVVESGTAGLDLLYAFDETEYLIIVDAAEMGEEPGTIRWFLPEEVTQSSALMLTSLHQAGVAEVLALAGKLGKRLSIFLCGIQPDSVDLSMDLTPAVAASVSTATDLIEQKIESLLSSSPTRTVSENSTV